MRVRERERDFLWRELFCQFSLTFKLDSFLCVCRNKLQKDVERKRDGEREMEKERWRKRDGEREEWSATHEFENKVKTIL